MKIIRILAATAILFPMSQAAWGQDKIIAATNRPALRSLASELRSRSEAAKAIAVQRAILKGWPIRAALPDRRVIELQRLSPTGKPVYYITDNLDAADTVSTDEVWPGGSAGLSLDGSGMTVGEWDAGGVLSSHQELTGRATNKELP